MSSYRYRCGCLSVQGHFYLCKRHREIIDKEEDDIQMGFKKDGDINEND